MTAMSSSIESLCGGRIIGTPPAVSTARTYGADMQYRRNVPWASLSSCDDGVMPIIGFIVIPCLPSVSADPAYITVSIGKRLPSQGRSSIAWELNVGSERLHPERIHGCRFHPGSRPLTWHSIRCVILFISCRSHTDAAAGPRFLGIRSDPLDIAFF